MNTEITTSCTKANAHTVASLNKKVKVQRLLKTMNDAVSVYNVGIDIDGQYQMMVQGKEDSVSQAVALLGVLYGYSLYLPLLFEDGTQIAFIKKGYAGKPKNIWDTILEAEKLTETDKVAE